jgi:hypothetical protein
VVWCGTCSAKQGQMDAQWFDAGRGLLTWADGRPVVWCGTWSAHMGRWMRNGLMRDVVCSHGQMDAQWFDAGRVLLNKGRWTPSGLMRDVVCSHGQMDAQWFDAGRCLLTWADGCAVVVVPIWLQSHNSETHHAIITYSGKIYNILYFYWVA